MAVLLLSCRSIVRAKEDRINENIFALHFEKN